MSDDTMKADAAVEMAVRGYDEMVLDSLREARESVSRAIKHYESCERDELERHEAARAAIVEKLTMLRSALATTAGEPVARLAANDRRCDKPGCRGVSGHRGRHHKSVS